MKIKAILITLFMGIVMTSEAAMAASKNRIERMEPTDW